MLRTGDTPHVEWQMIALPVLLVCILGLATPALGSLAGHDLLARHTPRLSALLDHRGVRLATGWTAAAAVLLLCLHGARARSNVTLGLSYPAWMALHYGTGLAFLAIVLLHTGGRWGWNLNGWLSFAALGSVFVGVAGKLAEMLLMTRIVLTRTSVPRERRSGGERRTPPRSRGPDRRIAPTPLLYRFRLGWTGVHLAVAAVLVVTIGFHVMSVWYF